MAHLETTLTLHTEHVGVGCDRDTYRSAFDQKTYRLAQFLYLYFAAISKYFHCPFHLASQLVYEGLSLEYLIWSLASLRNTFDYQTNMPVFHFSALQASQTFTF